MHIILREQPLPPVAPAKTKFELGLARTKRAESLLCFDLLSVTETWRVGQPQVLKQQRTNMEKRKIKCKRRPPRRHLLSFSGSSPFCSGILHRYHRKPRVRCRITASSTLYRYSKLGLVSKRSSRVGTGLGIRVRECSLVRTG